MGVILHKKKPLALCVFFLALCLLLPFKAAFAAPDEPTSTINSYLLADLDTGEIIFANKPDERIYPASVTKMMTALVLLEQIPDLSTKATVGSEINAFGPEASMMGLVEHENISYLDLLYGMMLVSGNDAAATVAVNIGGTIAGFADLMNAKAEALGMTNTHFVNPHGMNNEDHYTTASDLCKLACACMNNTTFAKVVKTSAYTTAPTNKAGSGHHLETTNRLLSEKDKYASYNYSAAIGIKTGSTSAAQGCLVAAAHQHGHTLIAVLMGDDSYTDGQKYIRRWTDAVKFFDYGFSLTRVDLVPYMAQVAVAAALPGAQETPVLRATLPETLGYWTDAATAANISQSGAITVRVEYNEDYAVFAPLQSALGTAIYSFGDEELCRAPLFVVPTAVKNTDSGNTVWARFLRIALWTLAFLVCLCLLFFVIIAPRLRRTRRNSRMQRHPSSQAKRDDTLLLRMESKKRQRPDSRTNERVQRQAKPQDMQNGAAQSKNTDNVRVLHPRRRRNNRIDRAPLYDDDKPDDNKRQ